MSNFIVSGYSFPSGIRFDSRTLLLLDNKMVFHPFSLASFIEANFSNVDSLNSRHTSH